jgi:ribosomal subunit interface protein
VDRVDIVVKGRHRAVPERFRSHVEAKLAKLERYDGKVIRVDVELSQEHNKRLSDVRDRVELTVYTRGPVIRAEAAAADPYSALDGAAGKLAERLRRAAERRTDHKHGPNGHGRAYVGPPPEPRADALTASPAALPPEPGQAGPAAGATGQPDAGVPAAGTGAEPAGTPTISPADVHAAQDRPGLTARRGLIARHGRTAPPGGAARPTEPAAGPDDEDRYAQPDRSPMVVRTKTHRAGPMTLDEALSNMELVGHDFYLFQDAGSGRASVVYRRRGYDYGVIHLIGPEDPEPASDEERTPAAARA